MTKQREEILRCLANFKDASIYPSVRKKAELIAVRMIEGKQSMKTVMPFIVGLLAEHQKLILKTMNQQNDAVQAARKLIMGDDYDG